MTPRKKPHRPRSSGDADKQIGLRIRSLRIDRHISQDTLAQQMGISFQQIQKYEKGTNRISGVRIMQIARVLGTSPHDLLGWQKTGDVNDTEFDLESYKLARDFRGLSPTLKTHMRQIIRTLQASGM